MAGMNFTRFNLQVLSAVQAVNHQQLSLNPNSKLRDIGVSKRTLVDFVEALNLACNVVLDIETARSWETVDDVCETLAQEHGHKSAADSSPASGLSE